MNYKELFKQDKVNRKQLFESVGELYEHQHFLLDVFMRVGKSGLATALINKWNPKKILILTSADTTNQQWIENLEKFNPHLINITDIHCYQSLHKIEDVYDVVCLDEFDTACTDKRWDLIQNLNPDHWVAMSGTLEEEHKDLFRELTNNKFFHVEISLEQAVKWEILPTPKIFAVSLKMDNLKDYLVYYSGKDKKKKNEIVSFKDRWTSFKNKKVNTLVKCTEVQYHELICQEFERWKGYELEFSLPVEEKGETIKFLMSRGFNATICRDKKMRTGNNRKKFFANIKNRHFKTLFKQLPENSRVLVFCNDTAQADLLNEEFSVHSNKPGSIELIEKFNRKEIPYLFLNKMADRGVDFVDVDYLVIIQSSMKQGSQSQRFARSLLSVAPKTIVMFYPGTQDETYINKFLEQFKPEWIIRKSL